jgi:type VI secretion system protein ImpG
MDPRLLEYYNSELRHLREMGGEFAKEFPKIAARIGLDGFDCADPYVERLLEGFAFLAARVQLKVDAEFPRFTQHLLDMIYPNYNEPVPSMAVVQLQPDLSEGSLAEGYTVDRHTLLRSQITKGEQTACEYRTAHPVELWPLEITEAEYLPSLGAVANFNVPSLSGLRSGIRLRLKTTAGVNFNDLKLDRLPVYVRGVGEIPMRIYEQVIGNSFAVCVQTTASTESKQWLIQDYPVKRYGFDDAQALLAYSPRSFQGYRLLQEYFALPERFMFFELTQLKKAIKQAECNELDIFILLNRSNAKLINAVDASQFVLFCTPAINQFPKRVDRIMLDQKLTEFHVVPDRTRPIDYEICQITDVMGIGQDDNKEIEQHFLPFYQFSDTRDYANHTAYYALHRQQRLLSSKRKRVGPRSSYIGNEVFISLVDGHEAPYNQKLRQLSIQTLCSNRDLPLLMPVGIGETDFTMAQGAPVLAMRCICGPTKPRSSNVSAGTAWHIINHLSLNYLSLMDNNSKEGAVALRHILKLYAENSDASIAKQIEGLLSISAGSVVRRINSKGPIVFGRGLEINVKFEEAAFEGTGVFLLGAVLEQFFARYVSINSFTETVIHSTDRGEIIRWPTRTGTRETI